MTEVLLKIVDFNYSEMNDNDIQTKEDKEFSPNS